jgi:hypothetical protein
VDFGVVRVVEDKVHNITLTNVGKYDVQYKFSIASEAVSSLVTITPSEALIQPGKEALVQVGHPGAEGAVRATGGEEGGVLVQPGKEALVQVEWGLAAGCGGCRGDGCGQGGGGGGGCSWVGSRRAASALAAERWPHAQPPKRCTGRVPAACTGALEQGAHAAQGGRVCEECRHQPVLHRTRHGAGGAGGQPPLAQQPHPPARPPTLLRAT